MLDTMLVSVLSIIDVNLEYLKTPSNFCKTFKLYSAILSVISDFKVSEDFVVNLELYFTLEFTNILVISGSTIIGLTDTTLNFFNCLTILSLVEVVNVEPLAALIAILTVP
jgi:hypothetical protein